MSSNTFLLTCMDHDTLESMRENMEKRVYWLQDSMLIEDYKQILSDVNAEIEKRQGMSSRVEAS